MQLTFKKTLNPCFLLKKHKEERVFELRLTKIFKNHKERVFGGGKKTSKTPMFFVLSPNEEGEKL